ncbi:amidohydrolase family protein [Pseudonocardia xishanensis]|uniref:Amidohydrolase-related domain-containing protein n=1 Tax=Pseudonocardia xishanensis TaxID=630995 RepID=A0ABP8RJU8_9PSEU
MASTGSSTHVRFGDPQPLVVDSQVHLWRATDWLVEPAQTALGAVHGQSCEPEEMASRMRRAAVDAAVVVVPSWSGWDNRFALDAADRHPERFAVVGRFDPLSKGVENALKGWAEQPRAVGVRLTSKIRSDWTSPAYASFLAAAARLDLAVCVYPGAENLDLLAPLGRASGATLVVDHLGLPAPPVTPPPDERVLSGALASLTALSRVAGARVKLSGLPALSRLPFPYEDVWWLVRRMVEEFGPERTMWGSDITRTAAFGTLAEQRDYLGAIDGIDDRARADILGGTAIRTFGLHRLQPIEARG